MDFDPMLFSEHTLPSGMRLFFQQRPHLRFVACEIVLWSGTRQCPAGQEDLAHAVEHLIGSETKGYPVLNTTQLVKWHESQHWHMNLGTTEIDYCTYGGSAPLEHFEDMLAYLNAYLRKPTFVHSFEKEMEIIANERTDQNWSVEQVQAMRIRYNELYRDPQIVSWLTNGSDLSLITMDGVRAYHRQYYDCPNMDIIMVGGIDAETAVEMVNKAFPSAGTTMHRTPRAEPRVIAKPRRRTVELRKKGDKRKKENQVSSVALSWFWIVPPGGNDAVKVTIDCLEQLLEERIREKWQLNYGATTSVEYYQDHRRIEIETVVHPDYEHLVRRLFIETLRDVDAVIGELSERKSAFRRSHEIYDPEVDTTIESAIYDLVSIGRIETSAESIALYDAVTEDEVRAVLADILCREQYVLEIEES